MGARIEEPILQSQNNDRNWQRFHCSGRCFDAAILRAIECHNWLIQTLYKPQSTSFRTDWAEVNSGVNFDWVQRWVFRSVLPLNRKVGFYFSSKLSGLFTSLFLNFKNLSSIKNWYVSLFYSLFSIAMIGTMMKLHLVMVSTIAIVSSKTEIDTRSWVSSW